MATGNVEWEGDIYKLGEDEPYKKFLERCDCKEMVDYIQRDGLIDAWKDQGRDPECQSGTWKKTLL